MLEASPLQMGILSGAGVAPGVMFGLGIGVWADRMRLRPILVITSIVRALSLASVPAAFALDVLLMEQLYGVALINGVCRTFTSVSFGAYLPKVVGRGNLVEANSKLAASGSVVETSADSVGGWIAQLAVVRHWNPPARAGPRTSCDCRGGLGHLATLRCSVYHLWHKRSESATGGDSGWNVGSCDCHLPIRRHWGFSGGVALGRGAGRDSRLETDASGCWRMRSRRSGMAIPLTGVEAEGNYA